MEIDRGRELFDLRKIYVVNLKTGRPKKMPFVGVNRDFTVLFIFSFFIIIYFRSGFVTNVTMAVTRVDV